jgi:hypothetical protein
VEELAGEQTIVAAMVTAMAPAVTPAPSNVIPFSRSSVRQRYATTKTATKAAIITGVVLFSATAAAAGGVLPHAAQSAISRAVEHVGIHVDNPDKQTEDATASSTTIKTVTSSSIDTNDNSATGGNRPDANSAAKDGLCQSFFEHQNNPTKTDDSIAAKNLADAAAKAGQTITAFCATTTTATSIDDHGGAANGTSGNGANNSAGNGADDTNTSSTLPGNPTSGKGGTHSGADDTSTTTVSTPTPADPTITTTTIDNHGGTSGGGNSNGGNPKP